MIDINNKKRGKKLKCLICGGKTDQDDSLCCNDCRSEMMQEVCLEDFGVLIQ